MHYPAGPEGFLSLELQIPGRPGEIFLFWLVKAWEQRGGPIWETHELVDL